MIRSSRKGSLCFLHSGTKTTYTKYFQHVISLIWIFITNLMMKNVFLHVGAHKTGTTTLQSVLANNREDLRSEKIVYPDFGHADSHAQWANFIAGEAPHIEKEKHAQHTTQWLQNLEHDEVLLLSAEALYRHINNQADYLPKLRATLAGAEIVPVLCLRNQGSYARSLYNEWVVNWQYPHNIYKFISEFSAWFDYEGFVKKISQLGKPILMSYHEIGGANLSSNFLQQLGYSIELMEDKIYLRQSPSDAEVYLKRLLNNSYPEPKHRNLIKNTVKEVISTKFPELRMPMPALIWSGDLKANIFERSYKYSNSRLCQQYNKDEAAFFPSEVETRAQDVSLEILSKVKSAYSLVLQELKKF